MKYLKYVTSRALVGTHRLTPNALNRCTPTELDLYFTLIPKPSPKDAIRHPNLFKYLIRDARITYQLMEIAFKFGHSSVIKYIVNHTRTRPDSLLVEACKVNRPRLIEYLIRRGWRVTHECFEEARRMRNIEVLDYLNQTNAH